MFCRVPYVEIGGKHRPYLEVIFFDSLNQKNSSKTFAMVDSGADHTVIPFSLGSLIGLSAPNQQEMLANVSGVGGDLSYIAARQCKIYLANRNTKKVYIFDETVWWIYPDVATQAEQQRLSQSFTDINNFQNQSLPNTDLYRHFEQQKQQIIKDFLKISNRLETNVLLGRPFFDNFEFIQFVHKDRNREDKCYFNYKVAKGKPAQILPLDQTILAGQIQTITKKVI